VIPLYRSEIAFKLEHDSDALLDRLQAAGVNELLTVGRQPVTPPVQDEPQPGKQPVSAPEEPQATGRSKALGMFLGLVFLVLAIMVINGFLKSGIKQAVRSSAPPVEFIVPTGYKGPVWVIEDRGAGSPLAIQDGRYQLKIPPSGVLRLASVQPCEVHSSRTARYEDGTPLGVGAGSGSGASGITFYSGGKMVRVGGGPTRTLFFYFVGAEKEAQAFFAKPDPPRD
jgi:hypothetical protein